MTSSRKRAYMGLMAVGALALVVDRFVLSDSAPTAASAEEADSETGTAHSSLARDARPRASTGQTPNPQGDGGSTPGSTLNLSIPELPFPRRLKSFDISAPLRDIFARPYGALATGSDEDATEASGESSSEGKKLPAGRARFSRNNQLKGVMIDDGLRIAILEDHWVRIGDSIDGCTLSAIEGEAAIFHCRDGDVLLSPFRKASRKDP